MAKLVQVEIRTPRPTELGYIHTMVWIDATLKPKVGMGLLCKGDPRLWTCVAVYEKTNELDAINTEWKVGGLK